MKKLCNIVRTKKNRVEFLLPYNDVGQMGDIDPSLPTLVVGWDLGKKYIPGFNSIKYSYPEINTYWTLSEAESCAHYEEMIDTFCDKVLDQLITSYHYENVDIITLDSERLGNMKKYCQSDDEKIIYITEKQVFILSKKHRTIWGVSIDKVSYMGWSLNDTLPFTDAPCNRYVKNLSAVPIKLRHKLKDNIWKILVILVYLSD